MHSIRSSLISAFATVVIGCTTSSCSLFRTTQQVNIQFEIPAPFLTPTSLQAKKVRTTATDPLSDTDWLNLPSEWSEFDCLGLHVSGDRIDTQFNSALPDPSTCSDGSAELAAPGLLGGLLATQEGGSISLSVPMGTNRKVQLFGLNTSDGSCPDITELFSGLEVRTGGATHFRGNPSSTGADWPVLLAETQIDLFEDTTVRLTPHFFRENPTPVFCDGTQKSVQNELVLTALSIEGELPETYLTSSHPDPDLTDDFLVSYDFTARLYLDRRIPQDLTDINFALSDASIAAGCSIHFITITPVDGYTYEIQGTLDFSSITYDLSTPVDLTLTGEGLTDAFGRTLDDSPILVELALAQYLSTLDMDSSSGGGPTATVSQSDFSAGKFRLKLQIDDPTSIAHYSIQIRDQNETLLLDQPPVTPTLNSSSELVIEQASSSARGGSYSLTIYDLTGNSEQFDGDFDLPARVASLTASGEGFNCFITTSGQSIRCSGNDWFGQLGQGTDWPASFPSPALASISALSGVELKRVSGTEHTCVLMEIAGPPVSQEVYCWGANSLGQLGVMTGTQINNPLLTLDSDTLGASISDIVAGDEFTCALKSTGNVYCWGRSDSGQLGNDSYELIYNNATVPVLVKGVNPTTNPFLTGVSAISAGGSHACAAGATIPDNTGTPAPRVVCWGLNSHGQLGVPPEAVSGGIAKSATPVVVSGLAGAQELDSGDAFTCAHYTESSYVYCWGQNESGQLGVDPTTSTALYSPSTILFPGPISKVSAGANFLCGLASDNNQVYCLGNNEFGQLGNTTYSNTFDPTPVVKTIASSTTPTLAVDIASGSHHSCALESDQQTIRCWGRGQRGQLGRNSNFITTSITAEVASIPSLGGTIFSGTHRLNLFRSSSLARKADGTTYGWGANFYNGPLAPRPPSQDDITLVTAIDAPLIGATIDPFIQVVAGNFFACSLTQSGQVQCWGTNDFGQLGANSPSDSSTPLQVFASGVKQISASAENACAVLDTTSSTNPGTVSCWGRNTHWNLGNTSYNPINSPAWGSPLEVLESVTPINSVLAVSVGRDGACAVKNTGELYCWGDMQFPTFSTSATLRISSGVIQMAAGHGRACAVFDDGTVTCWGNNNFGGAVPSATHGTTVASPTLVTGLPEIRQVAMGSGHTCALTDAGDSSEVFCWGEYDDGALGNENTDTAPTVPDSGSWRLGPRSLSAGLYQTCAAYAVGDYECAGAGFGSTPSSITLE